ncbi:MAG: hypothetical protein A4E57_00146 [Syntrophorhabdaceae bacterium PtaU1.Bin034]|nr:MAG: hypothetical protein A4E57_00146 [Syntrophorhabdaceae bacterium PtaU1.Bin034]
MYSREDMWDDLSSCEDGDKAHLQTYKETKALVDCIGKAEVIRLLYLNHTHWINWNDMHERGDISAKPRYVKDRRL